MYEEALSVQCWVRPFRCTNCCHCWQPPLTSACRMFVQHRHVCNVWFNMCAAGSVLYNPVTMAMPERRNTAWDEFCLFLLHCFLIPRRQSTWRKHRWPAVHIAAGWFRTFSLQKVHPREANCALCRGVDFKRVVHLWDRENVTIDTIALHYGNYGMHGFWGVIHNTHSRMCRPLLFLFGPCSVFLPLWVPCKTTNSMEVQY